MTLILGMRALLLKEIMFITDANLTLCETHHRYNKREFLLWNRVQLRHATQ